MTGATTRCNFSTPQASMPADYDLQLLALLLEELDHGGEHVNL